MLDFIILVGLPCSGKSTFCADYIKNNSDAIIVSYDDTILKYYSMEVYNNNRFDSDAMYKLQVKDLLDAISEAKHPIIIDKTNLTRKARNRATSTLSKKKPKYRVKCIVFSIDKETFIERNNKRKAETGKYISSKIFDEMSEIYQIPDLNEEKYLDEINFL